MAESSPASVAVAKVAKVLSVSDMSKVASVVRSSFLSSSSEVTSEWMAVCFSAAFSSAASCRLRASWVLCLLLKRGSEAPTRNPLRTSFISVFRR